MKIMGSIMISAILIFPALTAMRLTGDFKRTVIFSALISVVGFIAGFIAACLLGLQTGASVVTIDLVIFCLVYLFAWLNAKRRQKAAAK